MLLRNFSRKQSLIAVFAIGCVLFLIFSTVLYRQYSYAQRTNQWTLHNYEVLRAARMVLIDVLNMETGMRGYLLTAQRQFLQPYNESQIWLDSETAELKDLVKDDGPIKNQTDGLFYEIRAFRALLGAEEKLLQRQGRSAVTSHILTQQKKAMDHLRQSFQNFIQPAQNNLKIQTDNLQWKQHEFIFVLIVGTISVIGAMSLLMIALLSLSARQRKAEEENQALEERFRIVMKGINDGLFDYDIQNKKIYFSPTYKAMLGYEDEEMSNTLEALNDHLHPDDITKKWDTLQRYQDREIHTYTNYFRMRHKDGSWRWVLARGIGIWDKNNCMTRLIGTHTDVTVQKKREEELRELNTDLENFAYIASHDLRAPLVNLKGFAGEMEHTLGIVKPLLKRAETSLSPKEKEICAQAFDQEFPEALKFIQKSVEKMDILTNAVLDLSRIGRRDFVLQPVNLQAIAERCLDTLAYELAQKDVDISINNLPIIVSDPMALEQALSNLLDNAIKYLVPGKKGKIIISSEIQANEIIISIRDNGRGIGQLDQNKVFEIFRRARNVGEERGVGMGLAYVKAILRKLSGVIWFESQLGEGTVFYIRLPLSPIQFQQENAA